MNKDKASTQNPENDLAKVMIGLTRSSSQEVADGYGPDIQKEELKEDANRQGYELSSTQEIVEPATIDLEERELFKEILAKAIKLRKENKCDGLSFSRCDRLSRQFDGALQIALDCKKAGLAIRFVRENQWLKPDDEPIQFVMFVLQAFGVHTQTGITIANMNAGRRRAAAEGKLPSGVGDGMLGYTLANKKFTPDSFITVVDEILGRGLRGDSINSITRDLQAKDVSTPYGKLITRATVSSILRHARRYAGIWDWWGCEVRNLIPSRITEKQAEQILANLERNREKSHGFGKRKWLTSRVICGICGRKYNLRKKHGCACIRSDPMRANPPCPNVRITWRRLSNEVWNMFAFMLGNTESLERVVKDRRRSRRTQQKKIIGQVKNLEEQISQLQKKRRQYSWQQAEGIITAEELKSAFKQIKSEEDLMKEQLGRLEGFHNQPAPPSVETFKKVAGFWADETLHELLHASDEVRDKFAQLFDLYATIKPDSNKDGYHIDLSANIPLEMEGKSPSAYEMVFSPSRGELRG
jgi:DNA invertase Pin-like site-specific DNA recombinase